jgi:hypothetical protein
LLLSVTGGAESFDLSPTLLRRITEGLWNTTRMKNAWFLTGGTSSGVMKLIGEAMGTLPNTPLIGIGISVHADDRP